jgi:hypothetical protein
VGALEQLIVLSKHFIKTTCGSRMIKLHYYIIDVAGGWYCRVAGSRLEGKGSKGNTCHKYRAVRFVDHGAARTI